MKQLCNLSQLASTALADALKAQGQVDYQDAEGVYHRYFLLADGEQVIDLLLSHQQATDVLTLTKLIFLQAGSGKSTTIDNSDGTVTDLGGWQLAQQEYQRLQTQRQRLLEITGKPAIEASNNEPLQGWARLEAKISANGTLTNPIDNSGLGAIALANLVHSHNDTHGDKIYFCSSSTDHKILINRFAGNYDQPQEPYHIRGYHTFSSKQHYQTKQAPPHLRQATPPKVAEKKAIATQNHQQKLSSIVNTITNSSANAGTTGFNYEPEVHLQANTPTKPIAKPHAATSASSVPVQLASGVEEHTHTLEHVQHLPVTPPERVKTSASINEVSTAHKRTNQQASGNAKACDKDTTNKANNATNNANEQRDPSADKQQTGEAILAQANRQLQSFGALLSVKRAQEVSATIRKSTRLLKFSSKHLHRKMPDIAMALSGVAHHKLAAAKPDYDFLTDHQKYLSKLLPKRWLLISVLVMLVIIPGFMNTGMGPAIKEIKEQFGTNIIALQAWYLVGMAAGQLFWGPVLDSFGRKPTVLFLATAGVIINFTMINIESGLILFLCRWLQGFFFGGLSMCPAIILKDIFSTRNFVLYNSWVILFLLLAPALGPLVSGQIVYYFQNWRWTINILTLFLVFIVVAFTFYIPETIEQRKDDLTTNQKADKQTEGGPVSSESSPISSTASNINRDVATAPSSQTPQTIATSLQKSTQPRVLPYKLNHEAADVINRARRYQPQNLGQRYWLVQQFFRSLVPVDLNNRWQQTKADLTSKFLHLFDFKQQLNVYRTILTNRRARYLVALNVGYSITIFALPILTPNLYIYVYGIPENLFGLYLIMPVLCTLIGNRINVMLVRRKISPRKVWIRASIIQSVFTLVNFTVSWFFLGPLGIMFAFAANLFFNGFQLGNIQALYLNLFQEYTATANSILNFLRTAVASIFIWIVGNLPHGNGATILHLDAIIIVSCTIGTIYYAKIFKAFVSHEQDKKDEQANQEKKLEKQRHQDSEQGNSSTDTATSNNTTASTPLTQEQVIAANHETFAQLRQQLQANARRLKAKKNPEEATIRETSTAAKTITTSDVSDNATTTSSSGIDCVVERMKKHIHNYSQAREQALQTVKSIWNNHETDEENEEEHDANKIADSSTTSATASDTSASKLSTDTRDNTE